MSAQEMKTMDDVRTRIQGAIDAAWPAGMSLSEEDFQSEISARLDEIAVSYMAQFPDLRTMSLDEWLAEHREALSEEERAIALEILQAYDVEPAQDESPDGP